MVYQTFVFRSTDEAVIQLRKFLNAFHPIDNRDGDNEETEGVYHREKRQVDRGVT